MDQSAGNRHVSKKTSEYKVTSTKSRHIIKYVGSMSTTQSEQESKHDIKEKSLDNDVDFRIKEKVSEIEAISKLLDSKMNILSCRQNDLVKMTSATVRMIEESNSFHRNFSFDDEYESLRRRKEEKALYWLKWLLLCFFIFVLFDSRYTLIELRSQLNEIEMTFQEFKSSCLRKFASLPHYLL